MRLLVVEDEIDLCEAIVEGLEIEGFAVDSVNDGEKALELIDVEMYDLIVLDLNLPNIDGIEILKTIRKNNDYLKVIILSARNSVESKVKALNLGANDYLEKPFAFDELIARINNLLRREFIQQDNIINWNEISLDSSKKLVTINQNEVKLTNKEYSILRYLMYNQDRVISSEEIMSHVWNMEADAFSNAVRVHIASLRKKLKKKLNYNPINTKIGVGYFLEKSNYEEPNL